MGNGKTTLNELSRDSLIAVSKNTLPIVVNSSKMLRYKERKLQPYMTKIYQQNRQNQTRDHMSRK